ncbi:MULTISPECIES: NTP transferase domain-containing protein [Actinomycetes]|uniref:NTP transferase domain-containing protein n=1 Tax=Actinomycetes TaxID=1760 RepID=UPI0031E2CB8C
MQPESGPESAPSPEPPDSSAPGGEAPGPSVAAVLLAGGRGSRLGGVEKGLLTRDGVPLITCWAEALGRRDIPAVVVGTPSLRPHLPPGVRLTREDPPYSGPAAAVCAGVRALEAVPWPRHLLLLAVDTLDPDAVLDWLLARLPDDGALIPRDAEGRAQMLTAAVEAGALRRRVLSLVPGEEVGRPVRWLLDGISSGNLTPDGGASAPGEEGAPGPRLPDGLGVDVDTAADALRHGVEVPPEQDPRDTGL